MPLSIQLYRFGDSRTRVVGPVRSPHQMSNSPDWKRLRERESCDEAAVSAEYSLFDSHSLPDHVDSYETPWMTSIR